MRALIRAFDGLLRRANGVFEFCDDSDCLLRLQLRGAPHPLHLCDGTLVRKGDSVLILHLWNERIPPIGAAGPDLLWANRMRRMFLYSLTVTARWMAQPPFRSDVRAVGGASALIALGGQDASPRLMQRLGFEVFPYRAPLGRFGEFWENFYSWGLMWAFNSASLRGKRLVDLRRTEIWIPAQEFLRRYA
jgi:hypothetical protein